MSEKKIFEDKKIMLASWGCSLKDHYQCRDWIPVLKKLFGKVSVFSPRDYYLRYGKENMNDRFLKIIKKESPDYLLFGLSYDEFCPETLASISQISPKAIKIGFFGDDNWRYDDWSRYYALFFDYIITSEKDNSDYLKDGIKNVSFLHGINPDVLKPMNIEKKYDVGFLGMPIRDRYDYISYLNKNGINVKVWGRDWDKYDDLKGNCGGILSSDEYVKVINQSKVNLSFSKTLLEGKGKKDRQLKGRIFEVGACKSFMLVEQFPQSEEFYKGFSRISFDSKDELLRKVRYYLGNEEERNKISEDLYKQTIKNYTWEAQFRKFFSALNKKRKGILLTENKRILAITKKEIRLPNDKIVDLAEGYDYIVLKEKNSKESNYRNFFQAYSLEKSKKPISCCDYYGYSENLGNYILFMAKRAFKTLKYEDFVPMVHLSQLMTTKEYFIKNIERFKRAFRDKRVEMIAENNTIFVSIPLVRIESPKVNSKMPKDALRFIFMDKLYSLAYQKNILFSLYPYKLIIKSITNPFILNNIYKNLINKENWEKLKNRF
jgi:hypothetical protein